MLLKGQVARAVNFQSAAVLLRQILPGAKARQMLCSVKSDRTCFCDAISQEVE